MNSIAIGHFLVLVSSAGAHHRFQNFFVNKSASYGPHSDYAFLPFGFSGVTVNRQGDNVDAELVFPNNELSRSWAVDAIQDGWLARVRTMRIDDIEDAGSSTLLVPYVGKVTAGSWDNTALTLNLNTVLDAVRSNIPHRVLDQNQCGPLPVTSNVRLS